MPAFNTYKLASLFFLIVLGYLIVQIVGSSGHGRIAELQDKIADESFEVDTLLQRNQLIAKDLRLIKNDPSQVEVLARYHFGMIKPGEIFIQTGR